MPMKARYQLVDERLFVATKHLHQLDSLRFQALRERKNARFRRVGQQNIAHETAVMGHGNNCFCHLIQGLIVGNSLFFHQPKRPDGPRSAGHSVAGNVHYMGRIDCCKRLSLHEFDDSTGYRVTAFGLNGGHKSQVFGRKTHGLLHPERPRCERTCLVEHHRIKHCDGIKPVASFKKNAFSACNTNAPEVAQGHTDDQSTRTTDDQKDQSALQPHGKCIVSRRE